MLAYAWKNLQQNSLTFSVLLAIVHTVIAEAQHHENTDSCDNEAMTSALELILSDKFQVYMFASPVDESSS
jgi:hypothetical protein